MRRTIIILTICLIGCLAYLGYAIADITKADVVVIRATEESLSITHEFEVSASVAPSDCNTCIKYNQPSQCLTACHDIIIYD